MYLELLSLMRSAKGIWGVQVTNEQYQTSWGRCQSFLVYHKSENNDPFLCSYLNRSQVFIVLLVFVALPLNSTMPEYHLHWGQLYGSLSTGWNTCCMFALNLNQLIPLYILSDFLEEFNLLFSIIVARKLPVDGS